MTDKKKKQAKQEEETKQKQTGDIGEILDEMVPEEEKKQDNKPKQNATAKGGTAKSQANTGDSKVPTKDEKFNREWTIHYAGMVDRIPKSAAEEGLTPEEIRQHLETLYPEMSIERTNFKVDRDNKRMAITVGGGKNG